MGAKTTIKSIVPSGTHITAAQSLGRDAQTGITEAQTQLTDSVSSLKLIVADMTAGNPSDPNIATLNTVITTLS